MFVWLFTSCSVMRECPVETLQPAQISFDSLRRSIAVYAPSGLFDLSVSSNEGTAAIAADSLVYNLLYSVKSYLEQSPGFQKTRVEVFLADHPTEIPVACDWYIGFSHLELHNSTYARPHVFFPSWTVYLQVRSAIVCSVGRDEQVLHSFEKHDLLEWSATIGAGDDPALYLPSVADAWWDTGIAIARACTDHIAPHWQEEWRPVFMISRFPDDSALAYTAMKDGNYARAYEMWDEMLISCRKRGQKRMKSRILHNMAVTLEMQDRIEDAVQQVRQSIRYSSLPENREYLRLLLQRLSQKTELDKQIQISFHSSL
ncbi:MAG: tetratricopeptide repeat protein [Bacteroidales bacterium]|jgi:hypothetical protein|nr:tetratricopeptide repeat protein [Bacteroidales bacterium]